MLCAGASAKRSELDGKVKGLLVHTPAKFTEWLIQQGLVRSEQYDNTRLELTIIIGLLLKGGPNKIDSPFPRYRMLADKNY